MDDSIVSGSNEDTRKRIEVLNGLPLGSIGRAADLLWLHFGALRQTTDRKGRIKWVGEWALHVQANWRIIRDSQIFVGQSDMFYQAACTERFDWDSEEKSRFDRKAETLNSFLQNSKATVRHVACDDFGGLELIIHDGICFETFPDASSDFPDFELWRLFEPARETDHFVFETPGCSTR